MKFWARIIYTDVINLFTFLPLLLGKKRRLTLLECNNDINSMIDVAKIADLVCSNNIRVSIVLKAVNYTVSSSSIIMMKSVAFSLLNIG